MTDLTLTLKIKPKYTLDMSPLIPDNLAGLNQTAIKKIVATGNVDFVSQQYSAKTDKMEYDFVTQILVLTGDGSTVTMDKNSIVGSKITYYRADGRFKVEGGPDKRINATFFSDGKVSDMLGGGEPKKKN